MAVSRKRKVEKPVEEAWRRQRISNRKAVAWVLAVPALAFGVAALFRFDAGGRTEEVEAQVLSTRVWDHTAADGTTHPHTAATLQIGDDTAELDKADGSSPGDTLRVKIQRGRLTGRVTAVSLAQRPMAPGGNPIPGLPLPPID